MNIKLSKHQLVLLIISSIIILYSIFLVKYDHWTIDMYFFLHLFNLIIAIDFIFYILNCSPVNAKFHYYFCIFPLTRFQVLKIELKKYISRWELLGLIFSFLFFNCNFFLLNIKNYYKLIFFLANYLIQIAFIISMLFIVKNLSNNKGLDSWLKNLISLYISIQLLVTAFADKSQFFTNILIINPLSNGFLSYLTGVKFGIIGSLLSISIGVLFFIIARNKFKVWNLS